MIDLIVALTPLYKPYCDYAKYADGRNGNWINAFGGGKVSSTPMLTGNKTYVANILSTSSQRKSMTRRDKYGAQ